MHGVEVVDVDGHRQGADDHTGARPHELQVEAVRQPVAGEARVERHRVATAHAGNDAGQVLEVDAGVGGQDVDGDLVLDLLSLEVNESLAERDGRVPSRAELVQVPDAAAQGPGEIDVVLLRVLVAGDEGTVRARGEAAVAIGQVGLSKNIDAQGLWPAPPVRLTL